MSKVQRRGPGVAALTGFMRRINGARVVVGIQGSEGAWKYPPQRLGGPARPLSLVEVASVHEFGTEDGHVPARSFLRLTLKKKSSAYLSALRKALADGAGAVPQGEAAAVNALSVAFERVGLRVTRDVQATIRDGGPGWPALSPRTVAAKGSTSPLIDTGQLRQSIRHAVRGLR